MNKRSAFRLFLFLLYLSLVIAFFVFAKLRKPEESVECSNDSPCVRLCSENRNSIVIDQTSDEFELKNPITNITSIFKVLNGKTCERMKFLDSDRWKFSSVSS